MYFSIVHSEEFSRRVLNAQHTRGFDSAMSRKNM